MKGLPALLHVEGRRAVVVGGGKTAARRAAALVEAGAEVVVIAPRLDPAFDTMAVTRHERAYRAGDCEGAWLVVVATDDAEVNAAVAAEAERARILTNRADDQNAGDLAVPAHRRAGVVTVAVSTGGASGAAAAKLADACIEAIGPVWPGLLAAVGPLRYESQRKIVDPVIRRRVIAQMVDEKAIAAYRAGGEAALIEHCRKLIDEASDA